MPTNTSPKRKRNDDESGIAEQQPNKRIRVAADHVGRLVDFAPSTGATLQPPLRSVEEVSMITTYAWDGSRNQHASYNSVDRVVQEQRHEYIRDMKRSWTGIPLEDFFPLPLRPRDTPLNPYDLCNPVLKALFKLAKVTEGKYSVAMNALFYAPRHREGRGRWNGEAGFAIGSLDVEVAVVLCIRYAEVEDWFDQEAAEEVFTKVQGTAKKDKKLRKKMRKHMKRANAARRANRKALADVCAKGSDSVATDPSDETAQRVEQPTAPTMSQPDQAPTDDSDYQQQQGRRAADGPSAVLEAQNDHHDHPLPSEDEIPDNEGEEALEDGEVVEDGVASITTGLRRHSIIKV